MQLTNRIFLSLLAGILWIAPVSAQVNLAGKTVEWVIPFSETGGSAAWANFFAPLLSEALPGRPTVIVRFMPGAGSTRGANWFAQQRHRDGTLLFGSSGSTQFPFLLDDPRVRYEYDRWHPVMASGTGGVAYLNQENGYKFDGTANNLKGIRFIYGSQGATRLDLVPLLAWKMLGMTVEPVFGIRGRGDGRLMFERGEANIDYQTTSGYLGATQDLVRSGLAIPMMTWGTLNSQGEIIRDPTFPHLPTFKEVCDATDGCETRGEAWDAWKAFFVAGFPSQKIAFLPSGTPRNVINTYRAAFEAIKARPDFPVISARRVGKYEMFTGQGVQTALQSATTIDPSAKAYVLRWLAEDYGVILR